jgi:hypothetical protein
MHTRAETKIRCGFLRGNGANTNIIELDDLAIFAKPAELRRLADAIDAHLAVIDAEVMQVAA